MRKLRVVFNVILFVIHYSDRINATYIVFILGCDKKASGAVNWVNSNIVNVAATRAKYRLYIIGDYNGVWKKIKISLLRKILLINRLKVKLPMNFIFIGSFCLTGNRFPQQSTEGFI